MTSVTPLPQRRRYVAIVVAVVLCASAGHAVRAGASTAPYWRVSGQLGAHQACGTRAVSSGDFACAYSAPNPASTKGNVQLVLQVRNTSTSTTCYGVSLSTSYFAGLNDFCVKANAKSSFRSQGPAGHYRQVSVSVFVTSGSKNRPIAPERSTSSSSFSVELEATS